MKRITFTIAALLAAFAFTIAAGAPAPTEGDMLVMFCVIAGAVALVVVSWPTSATSGARFYVGKIGDGIAAFVGAIVFAVVALAALFWLLQRLFGE
jgi:hypothetical protein